jgi:type II secretion system protein D
MQHRLITISSILGIMLTWVIAQTPNQPAPAQAGADRLPLPPIPVPPAVTAPDGVIPVAPRPAASANATSEANGISSDGRMPTLPAGQDNRAVRAPNPNDVCDFPFNFPNLNAEGLGYVYRQLTGRRVVMTAEVKDLAIYFVQPPPITYGEATDLLKAACLMHGFVFAPGGVGWDKLTTATQGPKPGTGEIPLVTSAAALPMADEVVRYVMTLKYMKPDEVMRVFQTVVTQFNSFGSIVAVPNASALIITENTSLIRALIELQAKIDVPSSNIETKFIRVQFGDVEELAATLNEIFTAQSSTQSTAGVQRVAQPAPASGPGGQAAAAAAAAAGGSGVGEAPPIQIVPDIRTNRIFVMARPLDLVFIESLVKEFDAPSDQRNFLRRKLKFLAVADFLDVASDALSRAFGGSADGGGASAGGRAATSTNLGRGATNNRAGAGTNNRSTALNQAGGNQFGGNNAGGGANAGGSNLSGPQVDTKPVSVLVGRTLLVADNITNSIVVQGPPAGVEIINNLLDEIDVKADQVMISTVFGQLTLSNDLEYGLDWFKRLGDDNVAGSIGGLLPLTGTTASTTDNIFTTNNPLNLGTNGGLGVYGKMGNNLNVFLKALQETGDFNVISRPTIFTANNQKGFISSGQQIAVPSNSFNGGFNGGQSTNIEYRDVVLSLEVVPLVNSQDEVTLQISLVSQGVGQNRQIGSGENAFEVPDIISRELLTTVTVPNNQTVVLGGLITEETSKAVKGVPLISQIPGIGKLFSSTTDKKSRNELVIFIQPKVIRDQRSMAVANQDMDRRYEMAGKIRELDEASVLPIVPVDEMLPDPQTLPAEAVETPEPVKTPAMPKATNAATNAEQKPTFWEKIRKKPKQ